MDGGCPFESSRAAKAALLLREALREYEVLCGKETECYRTVEWKLKRLKERAEKLKH